MTNDAMTNDALNILPMTLIRSGGLPLGAWASLACGLPDWAALEKAEMITALQVLGAFEEALKVLPNSPLRTAVYNARKDFFQRRKMPSARVCAIIQAEESLSQLDESLRLWQNSQQDKQAAEAVFEQNLADNYRAIQAIANDRDETLRRALLFASHDLLASLPAFVEKPVEAFDKKDRRIALSLLQYLTRAMFKTSPLGRFTTVQVRDLSSLHGPVERVGEWHEFKSLVSPNVALLPAIYEVLLREPAFFQSLSISLNPCISPPQLSESFKLSESSWLYFDGEREAFQQMDPDPVADFVVKTLLENQRELPFLELVEVLGHEVDATEEQLRGLIGRLLDIGLLEWQLPERGLSPNWCDRLYRCLGFLPSSPVLTEAAYLLQWLRTAARTMPFQPIEKAKNLQNETLQEAKTFLEKNGSEMPPIPPEQIFFEDVARDVPLNLPNGTIEKLIDQLAECWRQQEFHSVPPFRARLFDFANKYLENSKGIGFLEFSRAFLEDGNAASQSPETHSRWSKHPANPVHNKLGALLQIYQENGEYKAVVNAMYPGGGKLFARWLPLFLSEVSENLKAWNAPPPRLGRLRGGFPLARLVERQFSARAFGRFAGSARGSRGEFAQ